MRPVRTAFLLGLLLVATRSSVLAQGTATVEGHVTDAQHRAVADVIIRVMGTGFTTRTNSEGFYSMRDVPMGLITLRADCGGYESLEYSELRLAPGQKMTLDFTLVALPPPPPGSGLVFRFQLLQPTDAPTSDRALGGIDEALRGRFRWKGYRLLTQAVVASDLPGRVPLQSVQALEADGEQYELSVIIDSVSGQGVQMHVTLNGWIRLPNSSADNRRPPDGNMRRTTLLGTTVTAAFGHTFVLGSAQTSRSGSRSGTANGTLILVVTPELRVP